MIKKIISISLLSLSILFILNGCTPNQPIKDIDKFALQKREIEKRFKYVKVVRLADINNRPLSEPKGLTFTPDNYLLIVESENNKIHRHDTEGNYLTEFTVKFEKEDFLSFPESIAYSPDKTFFISDSSNSRVLKVSRYGKVLKEIKSDDPTGLFMESNLKDGAGINLNLPSGITISPKGEIFIADTYNNRIVQVSLSGELMWTFGDTKNSNGKLFHPRDIAVDLKGLLYVTDDENQVKIIKKKKGIIGMFGGEGSGPGKFKRPKGLTLWHDKYIVVCDPLNHRIQFFTKEGIFIKSISKIGKVTLKYPYAVKTDVFQNLYIIDKELAILFKVYEL